MPTDTSLHEAVARAIVRARNVVPNTDRDDGMTEGVARIHMMLAEQAADAVIPLILEEAAKVAALFIIKRNSIHPDIPFDQVGPNVNMIAHTTCQYVADAIRALQDKDGTQ